MPRTVCIVLSSLMPFLLAGCFLQAFKQPKAPPAYEQNLQLGAVFEERGEWSRAEQEYSAAAQTTDKGNLALAKLYAQRGKLAQSETYFRLAMRTIRDDPNLYNGLAHILLERKKNLEEAEELAQLAVKIGNQDTFEASWDLLNSIREARQPHAKATPAATPPKTPTAPAAPKAPVPPQAAPSASPQKTPAAHEKTPAAPAAHGKVPAPAPTKAIPAPKPVPVKAPQSTTPQKHPAAQKVTPHKASPSVKAPGIKPASPPKSKPAACRQKESLLQRQGAADTQAITRAHPKIHAGQALNSVSNS
ncbi:MAG: hypothetical protein RRY20_04635 [Bilophila sp.]